MILQTYDKTYWFYVQTSQPGAPGFARFAQFSFSEGLDISTPYTSLTKKIAMFQVREERFKAPIVTLDIIDDEGLSSKLFSRGMKFYVRWGCKLSTLSLANLVKTLGLLEIKGPMEKGMACFVYQSDGYFKDGKHHARCIARGGDFSSIDYTPQVFSGGATYDSVIRKMAVELLVPPANVIIMSKNALLPIDLKSQLVKGPAETPFKFLNRLAEKLGCDFQMNPGPNGTMILIFADRGLAKQASIQALALTGHAGEEHYFDYGHSRANIVGDPDYDLGEGSNFGSVPMPQMKDGKMVLQFTAAKGETTVQYSLNEKAIENELRGLDGKARLDKTIEIVGVKSADFMIGDRLNPKYEPYFIASEYSTVPEQAGWKFKFKCVPDPQVRVGNQVNLGTVPKVPGVNPFGSPQSAIPGHLKSENEPAPKRLWTVIGSTWTHTGSACTHELELGR